MEEYVMSMSTASYDSEHHDGAPDYGACRRPTPPVRRGDIFYADLSPVIGSEQGGLRPVLIVQNDVGNRYSPTVIAAVCMRAAGTPAAGMPARGTGIFRARRARIRQPPCGTRTKIGR